MEKKVILPVKNDVIFRLFFADERNIEFLIGFLKSVLKLPDGDYNVIEISDPNLLREFKGDKLGIVDIKLKTKSKKIIHIEMQLSVTPELLIFYDPDAGIALSDLIEINTLELCKLPENADGTPLYDWAKFIAAESEDELNMIAERNPQVGRAVVKLVELSADERARDLYERREKERRDISSQKKWAVKQRDFEIARTAVQMKLSTEDIIKLTGLTFEEVENLRNN